MGYLKAVTRKGFQDRLDAGKIPQEKKKIYVDRIKEEFEVVENLGFASYFLLIYKILNFCHESGVVVGAGRGSAAGSLVLYCVGVTQVDPIKYDLLFERFLSADRAEIKEIDGKTYMESGSLPDVDIDVDPERREEVIRYIEEVFPNKTCQISTLSKFTGKILIKDILKTVNTFSEEEAKSVSGMLTVEYGNVEKIEHALENNKIFSEFAEKHKKEIDCAILLQDLVRQKSVHAAGVLLCENDIDKTIPLELSSQKSTVTGLSMDDSQKFGIKIDILGLQTLTVVKYCLELAGITLDDIDVDDPIIYEFLKNNSQYYGLFQIAEGLGADTIRRVKPDNFEEIIHCVSLGRPGSMRDIPDYIKLKNKEKESDIDPRLIDILGPTYGLILFQETIMQLSRRMADFTGKDADGLRKGIGKKDMSKVLEYRDRFIEGSLNNGYDEGLVNKIWETIEASGNYSFNRSHAAAYSNLVAVTTYLKAKYTPQFFAALLLNAISNKKSDQQGVIEKISQEMAHFGVRFLPPSLLKSDLKFSINGNDIRYGLSAIKGVSEKNFEKLLEFRKDFANKIEIFEAAQQAGLNIGILSALIYSGCLDDFLKGSKDSRSRLVLEAQLYNILTKKEKIAALRLADKYNHDIINLVKHLHETELDEKDRPIITEKRKGTIKKRFDPFFQLYRHNKQHEQLSNYMFERHYLGYVFSVQLKDIFESEGEPFLSITELEDKPQKSDCTFVGIVSEVKSGIASNKKKTRWFRMVVSDETGSINCMLFNESIDLIEERNGGLPKKEDMVFIKGQKNGDSIFANRVSVQDRKVFLKMSQLAQKG